jgi:hypothetical protein
MAMSYFAVCTFDLKNATYDDYQNAYADLAKIGLPHIAVSSQGEKIILPTTTCAGAFEGTSAGTVRNDLCDRISKAFAARRLTSEIFVSIGGDWAWGHRKT